ncbi:MAG: isochorismatase [Acidimicrobiales bacterium]|nr:isochorismatase [Acidimicrobiales bacterium]
MPIDLSELLRPSHTAVVTSEVQQSVVGERSALPVLAEAARAMVPQVARLCAAARAVDAQVVHCVAARRADGKGSNANARLFLGVRRSPVTMEPGSPDVEVLPVLGPDPRDLVLTRLHGLGPMAGTDLDPVLRNLGVTTVVVTGVSVNVAITNLVMDAVNLGYQVVVPRDAVAGLPATYADEVIDNTLALLATITTTAGVLAAWDAADATLPAVAADTADTA